jgi:hypothetical protein
VYYTPYNFDVCGGGGGDTGPGPAPLLSLVLSLVLSMVSTKSAGKTFATFAVK